MKRTYILLFIISVVGSIVLISCKKELSCENCEDNNKPPISNAGADQTIILPTASINLDGRGSVDPDNNISSYTWLKISGPSSFNISDANALQTDVTSLVQGVYQFELKITDAGGLTGRDTMQVTVIASTGTVSCGNRPVINARLVPIGALSEGRIDMISGTAGNKIIFIGASHSGGVSWNTPVPVDIYDIANNTWSVHLLRPDNPQFTHFRLGAAVTSVGNKIFIAGGGDAMGDNQHHE